MNKLNDKRKVAFVVTSFVVGGVEKSFLDLMAAIDHDKYDITVYLPDSSGEWTQKLTDKYHVRYLKNETFKDILHKGIREHDYITIIRCIFYRMLSRIYRKHYYRKSTEFFIKSMPRIKEKYDCAIAYQIINDDCVLSTLFRIDSSKKIVWSHAFIHKDEEIYGQWYNKFDQIFCVSKYAKRVLVENFPFLGEKTEVFYNLVNDRNLIDLSNQEINSELRKDCDDIVIVTVGRLSEEKGQNIIPPVAKMLIDNGYYIKWYLIGDGPARTEILHQIRKYGMDSNVILLGNRDNPYPYVKKCDIYVQTSVVEGWGLTVSEAKVLKKPIVTTDAGVMKEQITSEWNGIVIDDRTVHSLYKAISRLIDQPELRNEFIEHLNNEDVCHRGEIIKLDKVLL